MCCSKPKRKSVWLNGLFLICAAIHTLPAQPAEYLDLSGSWRFRIDPQDLGLTQRWYERGTDDRNWEVIAVPAFWESNRTFAGYDGIAWYRTTFTLPEKFDRQQVYLGLGGVDDEFDLWLDGYHLGHFGDRETGQTYYMRKSIHDISARLKPGEHLLVLRVVDWQGGGGMHRAPVAIAADTSYFLTAAERLQEVVRMYPRALWPHWVRGSGVAWSVIGLKNAVWEALVSRDGALGAKDWPFTLSFWLDAGPAGLYAPEKYSQPELEWSLREGYLPVPLLAYGDSDFLIRQQYAVLPDMRNTYPQGIARIEITILSRREETRPAKLWLAVRPYQVQGRVGRVGEIDWNNECLAIEIDNRFRVWCNMGKPAVSLRQPVATLSLPDSPGDISLYAVLGEPQDPRHGTIDPLTGMNAAAFAWSVEIPPGETTVSFLVPLGADISTEMPQPVKLEQVISDWDKQLRAVAISIPDRRVSDAYYASLGHILINADENMPHPGPWAYDLFYYRDTAYILSALLRNRQFDFARHTIRHLMAAQLPTGEFPPSFDLNHRQVGKREWDSQGQALFTLAEFVRFTGDTDVISHHWEGIARGVDFLDSLLSGAPDGILPASWSAEDLGSGDWRHYWDDFWAIRGLHDAAWMANLIGKSEQTISFLIRAESLRKNVMRTILQLMESHHIGWIPNGPEDLFGSSMARGTTPGLWPGGALEISDPLVRKSFDYYWEKWIEPYGGAYLHQGKFWPYAFELGVCYVLLNQPERAHRILQWYLDHQTFPAVYAWGEQLDTTSFNFYAGDIPHGWVAADYLHLVQHLLFYAAGDTAVIGAGIPWDWIQSAQPIGVTNLPTYFGDLTYQLQYIPDDQKLKWELATDGRNLRGILLKLPVRVEIRQVELDGKRWTHHSGNDIRIPAGAQSVTAHLRMKKPK